jgi:hypothetical protein
MEYVDSKADPLIQIVKILPTQNKLSSITEC